MTNEKWSLDDFDTVQDSPDAPYCAHDGCGLVAVTAWISDDNPRQGRFWPLCFRHAFIAALHHDPEAQKLALGWAMTEGLKNRNDARVR